LGTLRSADREVWATVEDIVREAVEDLAAPYGIRADLEYTQGVPPVVNDEACAELATEAVRQVLGDEGIGTADQSSGGEDFAWYTEEIPGIYLRYGVWDGGGEQTDLHHPAFLLDESALRPAPGCSTPSRASADRDGRLRRGHELADHRRAGDLPGHQQAPGGLGVGQQEQLVLVDVRRQVRPHPVEVAARPAADKAVREGLT